MSIPGAEPWVDMLERDAVEESIRKALFLMADELEYNGDRRLSSDPPPDVGRYLRDMGLSPSVAAWVLEGEQ